MPPKLHKLRVHLDQFKDSLSAYSEEQEERFYQDVMDFVRHYLGQYNNNMTGDTFGV